MYAIVDETLLIEEEEALGNLGYELIKCPKTPLVSQGISSHPDIQMFPLNKNTLVVHKDITNEFRRELLDKNLILIDSTESLSKNYPGDIILNAYETEDYFIHNTSFTDSSVLELLNNKEIISVKQGYTKCSILPVSKKALITSDPSIASALEPWGFDILKVPYGDISLPGYNYGFIGGCGGLTDNNELLLFGDLKHYIYHHEVLKFLIKYDVKPIPLSSGKLRDRGSIFFF